MLLLSQSTKHPFPVTYLYCSLSRALCTPISLQFRSHSEEVGSYHVRYLAYRMFCSSTSFEGTGGDAASKTLASKYGAVLQKIGLECIEFSVRLQKFRYGSGFYHLNSSYFALKTARLTQDHLRSGCYCSSLSEMLYLRISQHS